MNDYTGIDGSLSDNKTSEERIDWLKLARERLNAGYWRQALQLMLTYLEGNEEQAGAAQRQAVNAWQRQGLRQAVQQTEGVKMETLEESLLWADGYETGRRIAYKTIAAAAVNGLKA